MEVSTAQPSSGSPSAAYPWWVMFERDDKRPAYGYDSYFSMGDPNTLATAGTTTGHLIQASLLLADPPASSRMCLQLRAHPGDAVATDTMVIVAHCDSESVLVQVTVIEDPKGNMPEATTNHFVYNAGDAAADPPRPPSLSLLPPYYIGEDYSGRPQSRGLSYIATGIVQHGEDEIVVAELTMATVTKKDAPELRAAELFLFRSSEWTVIRRPAIRNGDPQFGVFHENSFNDVGDRMLCWVNLDRGLLLCDVFEESPVLEYVKLPVYPCRSWPSSANRNVCATASCGALKLVDVFPRCCCGDEGTTNCKSSHGACVVNTWTLRMDDMEWVKDGMLDASELWVSGTYKGLPRLQLAHPMVSVEEAHVICFAMIQDDHTPYNEKTLWKVMVNTRSKSIQSFSCHPKALQGYDTCGVLVPSNVSYYLNPCPTSSSNSSPNSMGAERKVDAERSPVRRVGNDDAGNSILLQPSSKLSGEPTVQASEILAALQEIPSYGLDRDNMLQAIYRILCHGNGRKFGTLLSLPPNLRKDWLLTEIKASEA
ncbi:unnamed protein product [Urochloa humidicola]